LDRRRDPNPRSNIEALDKLRTPEERERLFADKLEQETKRFQRERLTQQVTAAHRLAVSSTTTKLDYKTDVEWSKEPKCS